MPDIDAKKIEELLPCPFCGGAAQAEHFESKLGRWRWSIGCNDHTSKADDGGEPAAECYGFQSMTSFATKAEAIAAWNRRASLTAESTGNGPHEVRFAPGWLARDVAAAAARLKPKGGDADERPSDNARHATSPGVTAGASVDGLWREHWFGSEPQKGSWVTAHNTLIRRLSTQLEEARRERDEAQTILAASDRGSPIYKAVERVLDEHSAWISMPNRKVAEAIALASGIAWHIAANEIISDAAAAAESEAAALRERVWVLEKALEPFAEAATKGEIGGYPPNYFVVQPNLRTPAAPAPPWRAANEMPTLQRNRQPVSG